jgi:flagellar hook-associated protein 3 FlgL
MIGLSTSAFYERATRQIGGLRSQAETLQQQIGSGERLSKSSDDPVAAARMRMLERGERLAQIDQRNSGRAQTDLKTADQALGSIADVVIRAKELAMQAANGTISQEQRTAIGGELAGLRQSLLSIANGRNAAGHALFGGQATGAAYTDDGTAATYVGTAGADPIGLGDGQSVNPAITGPELFAVDVGGSTTDIFAVLGNLAGALQSGGDPSAAASAALDGLDAGLDKVTTAQTVVGGRLSWIELMDQRREANGELVADEKAAVGGANLAATMTRLQEVMTVLEASQASFVRLSGLSLFDMMR